MIRLRSITLARGGRKLLDGASASIDIGERIALIGPNGSGKTTLLAALCDEVTLDGGDIDMPPMRIHRLEQALPGGDTPAWHFVRDGDAVLAATERRMADTEGTPEAADATERWVDAGGATAESRARQLLAGLGFDPAAQERPVTALSGGWRMRLNLARALFVPADLLLLDEPTNHLDLDAILWFERWLMRFRGTAMLVSHDRDFLDRTANATLAFEGGRLVRTPGGYSDYESQRAQRHAQAGRAAEIADRQRAHLSRFIDRFRAQATKARQVQSRIKAMQRLVAATPVRVESALDFEISAAAAPPDPMLTTEALACGHGSTVVLRDVRLTLRAGERIGVLGRNGAGKTTLVRSLIGELPPLAGTCRRARTLRVGYFAQQGIDELRGDETPLAHLVRRFPDERETELRSWLARFGLTGERAIEPVAPMSGGEKARLLLALTLREAPHLLVLDEPTNHLDAAARDALTEALAEFDGALLLVSHDRYLLRTCVDAFVLVGGGRLESFDGDLDDYAQWLQQQASAATASAASGDGEPRSRAGAGAKAGETPSRAISEHDRREQRRRAAQERTRRNALLAPVLQALREIDARLEAGNRRLAELDTELNNPLLYRDNNRATALSRERAAWLRERETIEERWLELAEERDRLQAEARG